MSSSRNESVRLIWLEAFVAVAEAGTYAAAARELDTSPETLSRYIDQLELWLWRRLRENANTVELTAIGQDFLPVARQAIGLLWAWRTERPQNIGKLKRPPAIPVKTTEEFIKQFRKIEKMSNAMFDRYIEQKINERINQSE